MPYHAAFQQFVASTDIVDDLTVKVTFKTPAPRFKFEVLTEKFDTGIPIVPEHWLSKQADVNMAPGSTEIPHSGPYDLIAWNANQKIFDYRPDWWAVKAGRIAEPAVKRIIIANITGVSMDTVAQRVVNNEFDSALDMRSSVIGNILAQNPEITTHTGNESPFGYLDWWPNSLWMNTQIEPYSDVRVRRAISLSINRDVINDVLYEGAKIATIYPFPLYPNLQAFADSPGVKALEEQYQPGKFDTEEAAKLMTEAGFALNGDGCGKRTARRSMRPSRRSKASMATSFRSWWKCCARAASTRPSTSAPTPTRTGRRQGRPLHVRPRRQPVRPVRSAQPLPRQVQQRIGTSAGNNRFSRYKNPEFDAILDEIAPLSSTIRSSSKAQPRRSASTGATRSTCRSSSGSTVSPTTSTTGRTGRPKPTRPWAPTARSGHRPVRS